MFNFFCDLHLDKSTCQKSSATRIIYSWSVDASGYASIIGVKVIFCLWLQATKRKRIGDDGRVSAVKDIANGTLKRGWFFRTTQKGKKRKPEGTGNVL